MKTERLVSSQQLDLGPLRFGQCFERFDSEIQVRPRGSERITNAEIPLDDAVNRRSARLWNMQEDEMVETDGEGHR
jgi:hypothetical protein